jgi:hypothetical protein
MEKMSASPHSQCALYAFLYLCWPLPPKKTLLMDVKSPGSEEALWIHMVNKISALGNVNNFSKHHAITGQHIHIRAAKNTFDRY